MTSRPTEPALRSQRHRVVIVGAGFAGLFAAKFLRTAPVDVVLIDRKNHHVFQPLLYQVATGILSPGQIAPATRSVLRRHRNVTVELGDVTDIDVPERSLTVERADGSGLVVEYDSLILATGVQQSYFGNEEFARYAPGMKTLEDALDQRERIFGAFERAELAQDEDERWAWLTFVVVGGGPTGVEMAGHLAELAKQTLADQYARIDPATARVLLFDGGEHILATFGDSLSGHATRELERAGVEIHVRSIVTGVDADGVAVKGADGVVTTYPSKTVIWAAGVEASPLGKIVADAAGIDVDRAGRVPVEPDCTVPGHPDIFVVGDLMTLNGLPGVAEVAMQCGIHAARTIKRRAEGDTTPKPFVYRDLGNMAAVARRRAIVSIRGIPVWGFLGWLMWMFVHLMFLTGFKNRFTTVISWTASFLGSGMNERAIVGRPGGPSRTSDR